MHILRLLLVTLLALAAYGTSSAAYAAPLRLSEVADSLPAYVIIVDQESEHIQNPLPDSTYHRIAGRTIFRVNRTELNTADPFVQELRDFVIPYCNRHGLALVGIDLRGAASPEGPYLNNVRLSKGRAKALTDYFKSSLDSVALNDMITTTVAEDYEYLLYLLDRADDSAAPLLRRIIERHGLDNPAAIKADLRALYDGRVWTRLLHDYFPYTRSARIVLIFKQFRPEPPERVGADRPFTLHIDELPPVPSIHYSVVVDRPHLLSIGTNLLYDGFYMPQYDWAPMPNINLEFFPPKGNFTYRLQFLFPYYHRWSKHKFFQIRDYHFEVRRYFNPGDLHTGLYLGAYVNNNIYGIGLGPKKGWQGEGLGGALKVGYVLPLGSGRWRMDFHVAAGYYTTRFDPYVWGNPVNGDIDGDYYYDWIGGSDAFRRRNHRFSWFGPTEVGVSISYDLLYYRLRAKGASMIRKEVLWP